MCSSSRENSEAIDDNKLSKFVELLVHDYLKAKGFDATGVKFAEECAAEAARDEGGKGVTVDDASTWYFLADKLALPVRNRSSRSLIWSTMTQWTLGYHGFGWQNFGLTLK